jgi:hypothetical protein
MSKLYLNSGKAKAKTEHKTRGRMKLVIKFNQDEAQALKNWTNQVKPPQIDEDTFYKQVFFNGVGALNQQLSEMAKSSLKDPAVREQLRQSGVDVEKLEQELYAGNVEGAVSPAVTEPEEKEPTALDNGVYEVTDQVDPVKPDTTQDATDTK